MSTASAASVLPSAAKPVPLPSAPAWTGGMRDLAREHAFESLRVRGKLPEGLVGTLYRNGPGRFSAAGKERYGHWFDGDGAVCAVRLAEGGATGAVRVVRTEGLEREERAGKRLFGGYGTPLARPIRELLFRDTKNAANTSVLLWQGRLFATCEAGKPYEIARGDLSTLGESDLGGALVGPFSAHSHRVPSRRTTYNFGMGYGPSTKVDVYALPDEGRARRIATFAIDGVRLNHDFAVTGNHLVFAFAPHYLSLVNTVLLRKPPVASARWRAERGTEIVVIPIDDPTTIRRFRVDAFFLEHVVNAFEEGGRLVVDYTHYAHADGLEHFVGGLTSGRVDAPLQSEIRRMRVDVAHEKIESETILARAVELPRVSPRMACSRHRYAYMGGFRSAAEGSFGVLIKHDLETGRVDTYDPGSRAYVGEGVFVPRQGATVEDDGWVLTMVYDANADASRLEVLDAGAIADGPLASCAFEQAIPFGFHGAFDGS
ncbi:MAG TPA: carotenoid oxygenase family protein [Polyangiaceae bacterium]|nr:carotenoid oxygenase family protein [Polyangiaceae bacterium]